jgi:ABC-type dipeptide/oligopeptide/nickel transport system ATPase component
MNAAPVLEVENLNVRFASAQQEVSCVSDFSLSVARGECVGVVGESGAGKSQAFLAIMGLLAPGGRASGRARFESHELIGAPRTALDRIRGARLTMIFQNPMTSLTPHLRVGDQVAELLVKHAGLSWRAARARALEMLARVQLPEPERRARQYPHELSGGMRQRVMIATALACEPALVIADEPTTALDVTLQAQILALLGELKSTQRLSLVLITHDLGVVAGLADRVAVMCAGRIVECGPVATILRSPAHAYTQSLLQAALRFDGPDP